MFKACVVCALCAVVSSAAPAAASVFFTFDDPATPLEVRYEQPNPGGDPFGTMSYTSDSVDLVVDASMEGGGIYDFVAVLTWTDWRVSEVTVAGPITSASVSGDFTFTDFNTAKTILSGSFSMGLVIEAFGAGSVITTTEGGLTYAVGEGMTDVAPEIMGLAAPFDGVYTLTDVRFDDTETVVVDNKTYFGDFSANAAFTGTADTIIPSPGAGALALIGGLGIVRRRRR